MSPRYSHALLAAGLVTLACSRPTPPQSATHTDSTPPDTVGTPAPAPPSTAETTAVAATPTPTTKPAAPPPKPASPSPKPATQPGPAKPAAPVVVASADPSVDPPPLRDAYHTAPLDTVDDRTYQGWKYFNLNCARCHGEDVQGTTIAPHLIMSLKPDGPIPNEETFTVTVCGGRPAKGMPAWCALGLTPATIDTIYAYVKGRSDAKLHPGRPARRSS